MTVTEKSHTLEWKSSFYMISLQNAERRGNFSTARRTAPENHVVCQFVRFLKISLFQKTAIHAGQRVETEVGSHSPVSIFNETNAMEIAKQSAQIALLRGSGRLI